MGRLTAVLLTALVAWSSTSMTGSAQTVTDRDRQALGRQIEQRFDVLPVQGGIVLKPKMGGRDIRSIELTGGSIAINGDAVTGAELKRRLNADADLILRLSYLEPSEQRALFEPSSAPNVSAAPAVPPAPTASAPAAASSSPTATTPPAAPTAPGHSSASGRKSDRVHIGGSVDVGTDEVVEGDVVAIGGSANIDGRVQGDVVAIGGAVNLESHADVQGDVTVIGGQLRRDPAARVGGEVHEIALSGINITPGAMRSALRQRRGLLAGSARSPVFTFISTVARLVVLCILASIVLLFGRAYVDRVSLRAASTPVKAGAIGLLIQLLFLPVLIATIVVMILTIVGIPLLLLVPFALAALALLLLIGFTAVAYDIGRLAVSRFGWEGQNQYVIAALGITIVLSPLLLSRLVGFAGLLWPLTWTLLVVGIIAEYLAWTVGLGAVALLRLEREKAAVQ
jgi:hypothetical protein